VDDIKEQRTIAQRILTKLGYNVKSVPSGEEALAYIQKKPVDLIVLDMIMDPGIDGLETYKRIIQLHPGQKAIIASGYSESERVKEAQKLGAGAYVKKPYLMEKLALAIKIELDR
jgi:CheY-like chemotaxis protein